MQKKINLAKIIVEKSLIEQIDTEVEIRRLMHEEEKVPEKQKRKNKK